MNLFKKRWLGFSGKKRRPAPSMNGPFLISGEKLEIKPLSSGSEAHLPQDSFPTLQELERDYIRKVLGHVSENRTRAAEILGIDRVSLWRKLKRYEIEAPLPASLRSKR